MSVPVENICGSDRISDAEAQKLHAAFVALCGSPSYVGLTTAKVIAAAKDKKSVLHKYFTWDTSRAAQLRWNDEARKLIGAVRYRMVVTGQEYTPRFAHPVKMKVKQDNGAVVQWRTYTAEKALRGDLRNQVIADHIARLESWLNATAGFEELRPLWLAISNLLKPKKKDVRATAKPARKRQLAAKQVAS
jgi:hypothetical protein